jgi:ketosteroid isomerase-like protein
MSTQSVLDHHLEAFGAGDVDETMEDYTDDSVLILPDATLTGLDAIRTAFTEFYGGLFRPGTYGFTMDRTEVVGDVAFILWHSTNEGADVTLGTDTFVIQDGKIAVQTFAAMVEEK